MSAPTAVPTPTYRVSALATALVRMWRAWSVILLVSLADAIIQVALVLAARSATSYAVFLLLAAVSYLGLVLSFGLVCRALLDSLDGRPVALRELMRETGRRFPALLAWSLAIVALATLGLLLYVVPGLIVLALFPYLLIAVVDAKANPLAVNFRTIAARWGRWIITAVIVGVIAFGIWLAAALDTFFLRTMPGLLAAWVLIGLVASWVICAWLLIYRGVNPTDT
ncbi:MAG: hypothetical protein ACKOT0_02545 [bacterium]